MPKPEVRHSSRAGTITFQSSAFLSSAFLASTVLAAPLAAGAKCFDRSPLTPPGADPHTAIESNQLSHSQKKAVDALFKSLRGRWQGKAKGYFCKGTRESPRQVSDNATAEIEVESYERDSVTIKAILTADDRRSSRNELLRLFLSDETLRVGRDTRAGETKVLSARRNQLAFAIKVFHRHGGAVGGIREVHRKILVTHNQMTIEFTVYSQGGLISTSRWTARRR